MRRRKNGSGDAEVKKKAVTVSLLKREHAGKVTYPYRLMEALIEEHHAHLADAKIAIAWDMAPPKEDADGRKKMGSVKKCSDLDREFAPFDFRITIPHEIWNNSAFTEARMAALMDHYLCRMAVCKDKNGEDKIDDRNRPVFRLRRPNVVEFSDVIARHGMWTTDLEQFAKSEAAFNDRPKNRPLFRLIGNDEVMGGNGKKRKGKPADEEADTVPIHDKKAKGDATRPSAGTANGGSNGHAKKAAAAHTT